MRKFLSMKRRDGTERKRFPAWECGNLRHILHNILHNIQTIVKPGSRFNKFDLQLIANGDGSYWLGLDEERPDDADLEFERREHEARLWTLDEDCDEENETQESDETLVYEAIIQFLETGGKCHGLKFRLSVISGNSVLK